MPTIVTNDVMEVTMVGSYYNQTVLNVFHYVYTGAGVTAPNYSAELAGVASSFMNKVYTAAPAPLRDRLVTDYNLARLRVQPVAPIRNHYFEITPALAGTIAQNGCTPNAQVTLSYQTDRALRGSTGNKRFTGCPVLQQLGDSWLGGYLTQWIATALNFVKTLDGAVVVDTYRPTVWSPRRAGDRSNLVGVVVNSGIRTTHSRTKGVGI